ncbi:VWA domain-containing protein [Lentibacillus lipolyticus]|nr:VWA domain-containing protein [Lentibacillus lipolyticus]
MKMIKRSSIIFLTLTSLFIVLAACSDENQGTSGEEDTQAKKASGKKEIDIPEAPTEPEKMVENGPGKSFANDLTDDDISQVLKEMPNNLKDKDIYNYLIDQFAYDYSDAMNAYESFDPQFKLTKAPDVQVDEDKVQHISLLLDSSGSMGAYVNGNRKMDEAKTALKDFASSMSEETKTSLIVYGHKGTGSEEDKALSCDSIELSYPLSTYDKDSFNKALKELEPAGWTPLAGSLEKASEVLGSDTGDNVENVIYVISDGTETCGGNPVNKAKELHESDLNATVNVIAFDVNSEEQKQLKEVADAGGGTFKSVANGKSMFEMVDEIVDEAVSGLEVNLWTAREGQDINKEHRGKQNELNDAESAFNAFIDDEHKALMDALAILEESGRINEKTANQTEQKISDRRDMLRQYNDRLRKEYGQALKDEREKTFDLLDDIKQKKMDELSKD